MNSSNIFLLGILSKTLKRDGCFMGNSVTCLKHLDFRLDKCAISFTEEIPAKVLSIAYKMSEYVCSISNMCNKCNLWLMVLIMSHLELNKPLWVK